MRHLLSYLLFVGIPLSGLLAVLRLGQAMEAPIAVHGAYAVRPLAPTGVECHRYLLTSGDSTLTVTQSGRQLTARLGPAESITLRGKLTGTDLTLEGVIQAGSAPRKAACSVGDTIRVAARVYRGGQLKRLDARLWSVGCAECGAFAFVAARPRRYEGRRRS